MSRKTVLIILYAVLILIIGAFIAQVIIEKAVTSEIIVRTVIPLGLCAGAIAKVRMGTGGQLRSKLFYETEYQSEIRTAFTGQGQQILRSNLLRAIRLYNENYLDKSVKQLQNLLPYCQFTDDYCAVLLFLGLIYTDMELPKLAEDTYYELLRHDQSRGAVWSNLGLLFKSQGKHRDALACFANALKYDHQKATIYHNIAATYFSIGAFELAIEYANTALDLKSNFRQPSDLLCMIYYLQQDEPNCKKYFELSVANGSDPKGLKDVLEVLKKRGFTPEFSIPLSQEFREVVSRLYIQTAIPFSHIVIPDEAKHPVNSRIGGASLGEPPLDHNGMPMRLLCLIDCSEVHSVPDFPTTGILRFFIADNPEYGANFDALNVQHNFRVLYTDGSDQLPEVPVPGKSDTFPIKGCYPIMFLPDVQGVSDEDYRFQDTLNRLLRDEGEPDFNQLPENVQDAICMRCHSEGHRIGGYPHFAQSDPRQSKEEYQRYDTLLLQIDTHDIGEDVKIMIGNNGVMNFLIPHEKLKEHDFTDILYTWDCY